MDEGFIRWASRSLAGHVVLMELCTAAPAYLFFMAMFLFEGHLTLARAFLVGLIVSVAAAGLATIFWFLISKPLINSRVR